MIVVADNLSGARASVRRAIEQRDAQAIAGLCTRVQAAGADWIDINPGYIPPGRRKELWSWLVGVVEDSCGLTLVIDSPEPEVLKMAAALCSRPPVLNMATAEPSRLKPVLEIAAAEGLELIAATITSTVPVTAAERLELAALILHEAEAMGIEPGRILLDPMVMPLAAPEGEKHARGVIETLRALAQVFDPPPRSIMALSNLVTRSAGAEARFAAGPFLAAAWGAGLSAVMMDALDGGLWQVIRLCEIFEGRRIFAPGEFSSPGDEGAPA